MKIWREVMLAVAAAGTVGLVLWWNGRSGQIAISDPLASIPVLVALLGLGVLITRLGLSKLRANGRGDVGKAITVIAVILLFPVLLGTAKREYATELIWAGCLVAASSLPLAFLLKPKQF